MAAEGLGLAASVAGLVSLGLQITGGVVSYLDAVDRREDDLAHLRQQNEALKVTLSALETMAAGLQSQQMAFSGTLVQNLRRCKNALGDAEKLRIELTDDNNKTWTTRLGNKKKKLTYKFHEPQIQQLSQRLQQTNEVLNLTLTGLGVEISRLNATKLTAIELSSQGIASELHQINSRIEAVRKPSIQINNNLPVLRDSISSVAHLVEHRSGLIVDEIQQSGQSTQEDIRGSMQSQFKQQQDDFEKKFEQLFEMLQRPHPTAFVAPSALRELCDNTQSHINRRKRYLPAKLATSTSRSAATRSYSSLQRTSATGCECICPRSWRVATAAGIQLGNAYISSQSETEGHWPSCPHSKWALSRSRRAWGVRYTGFTRIIKAAIDISFAYTSGAGGFSMSPNFTYTPTVDEKTDYAFRILEVLEDSLYFQLENRELVTTACLKKLVKVFDGGEALPWAVNCRNQSLMHFAAKIFLRSTNPTPEPNGSSFCLELTQTLVSYGVPAFSYDNEGLSPISCFELMIPKQTHDMVQFLIQANLGDNPVGLNPLTKHSVSAMLGYVLSGHCRVQHTNSMYEMYLGFAEAYGCGPLSLAVIRQDVGEVSRILGQSPDALTERDIHGQSPIHLASAKPQVLSLLVAAADLELLRSHDHYGSTVLDKAMRSSSVQCVNGRLPVRCHQCPCTECVNILLEAGCEVRTRAVDRTGFPPFTLGALLCEASEFARRLYIFRMKKFLVPQPDKIFGRLEAPGKQTLTMPHSVHNTVGTKRAESRDSESAGKPEKYPWAWIYSDICSPHLADLFYRHGFHPPPSLFAHLPWVIRTHLIPAYACWLVEHGVDMFQRSTQHSVNHESSSVGVFAAHFVFYLTQLPAIYRTSIHTIDHEMFNKHCEAVEHRGLTDGCDCSCTVGGCSPFTWLMKQNLDESPLDEQTRFIESYYQTCSTELLKLTYAAAIRFTTFEALGLQHTCCNPNDIMFGEDSCDSDDADAIDDNQASLLELLDELVAEFEEKAWEIIEQDTDTCTEFSRFWSSYWIVRMREVLETLDNDELTDEERRGAEEIGVRWCEPPNAEVEEDLNYKWGSLEYYFHRLDSICPEYNETWPAGLHKVTELS